MNLIDAEVTRVCAPPKLVFYRDREWWEVIVEYSDDGGDGQMKHLTFSHKSEADKVEAGYVFQH
jgi:hypothetical protein